MTSMTSVRSVVVSSVVLEEIELDLDRCNPKRWSMRVDCCGDGLAGTISMRKTDVELIGAY